MFELQNFKVFFETLTISNDPALYQRVRMTRFRRRNHKLPIEAGCRHGVLRENRICIAMWMEVGDEFHYLFKCSNFNDKRKRSLNWFYSQSQVRVVNECSNPALASKFQRNNMFLPYSLVNIQCCGSLRHRKVASSASNRQASNFESCVWRAVSSNSSYHTSTAQFNLYICTKVA